MASYSGYKVSSEVTEDYTARLQEMLAQPPVLAPRRHTRRYAEESDSERIEREMAAAMSEGDNNLIGYVGNYDTKVNQMVNLLQTDSRNFVKVKALYDELQSTASNSQSELDDLYGYADAGGNVTRKLAVDAQKLARGDYNNQSVTLSDGRETTIGQLFGGGGYEANRSRELSSLGYDSVVSSAYLGADEFKARAVGELVRPAFAKDGNHSKFRQQYSDSARYVADNYDSMASILGHDGALKLVQSVRDNYLESGAASYMMRGIMDYLDSVKDASGLTPGSKATEAFAKNGFSFVSDLMSAIGDAHRSLASSTVKPGERATLSPLSHRYITSVILSTLSAFEGEQVDLSAPRTRHAMTDVVGALVRADNAGYNLYDVVKTSSGDTSPKKVIADYIKAFAKGETPPPDNVIYRLGSMRRGLDSFLESAPTREVTPRSPAGESPASISRAADLMKKDINDAVERNIAPYVASGYRPDDAFLALTENDDQRTKISTDIENAVSRHIRGRGGQVIAQLIRTNYMGKLRGRGTPGPFSLYKTMADLALGNVDLSSLPERERALAQKTAADWYLSEVAEADRFSDYRRQIRNFRMSKYGSLGKGLSEHDADIAAAEAVRRATGLLRDGKPEEALAYLERSKKLGYRYREKLDKNGKPESFRIPGLDTIQQPKGLGNAVEVVVDELELTPEFVAEDTRLEHQYKLQQALIAQAAKEASKSND